jgi:hypothetical protein
MSDALRVAMVMPPMVSFEPVSPPKSAGSAASPVTRVSASSHARQRASCSAAMAA